VRPAANAAVRLTPHGPFAGFQDVTNSAYVAGWVWNHETPDTPVSVAIYDGALWLATVTAQMYRRDLHHAGIGNGAHGFVYPLERHLRDHRAHHITVQIVGTDVTLRDAGAGGLPPPVTRRDQPPVIPHFSLPPLWRWAYFTALRRILARTPVPVWRPLAAILACVDLACARHPRVLNVALLRALGVHASPATRWRTHWTRAYQRQADLILLAQGEHVTPPWAARQVDMPGRLPPGGAILVSVHHYGSRLAGPVLAAHGYHLGAITTRPRDPARALALHGAHLAVELRGSAVLARGGGAQGSTPPRRWRVSDHPRRRSRASSTLRPTARSVDDHASGRGVVRAAVGQAPRPVHDRAPGVAMAALDR